MALCILMLPLVPCTVPSTGEEAMHIANVTLANSDWLYLQATSILLTIRPVCRRHRLYLAGAVAEAQLTLAKLYNSNMQKNNTVVPMHVHFAYAVNGGFIHLQAWLTHAHAAVCIMPRLQQTCIATTQ